MQSGVDTVGFAAKSFEIQSFLNPSPLLATLRSGGLSEEQEEAKEREREEEEG